MSLIIFIKRCIPGEIIGHLNFSCENEKIIIYSGENKKKLKKIKDEYCFDFKREKFILGNMNIESSYLNFVFDNLNEKEKIENLKSIAENTVYNKFSISEYDDITEIFILNENREKLNSEDMLNFLKNLYENIIKSQDEVRKKNYVKSVFYKANTNPAIFRKLIDILFVNNIFVEDILKWYILDEIGESKDLRDVLKHISFWAKTSAKVNGSFCRTNCLCK
jgi:hypothetical protein